MIVYSELCIKQHKLTQKQHINYTQNNIFFHTIARKTLLLSNLFSNICIKNYINMLTKVTKTNSKIVRFHTKIVSKFDNFFIKVY